MPSVDSPKVIGKVRLVALVGDVGAVPHVADGPVRSIVMAVAVAALMGPALPAASVTPPAASTGASVPSEQPVAVTTTDVPLAADGEKVQPVAVPAFERSPATMPDTDLLRVSVNMGAVAAVGDAGEVQAAVGGVRSTITVGAATAAPGNGVFDESSTAFWARVRMTLPALVLGPPTVTVYGPPPDPVTDCTIQPVAVPLTAKSDAVSPVTASLTAKVNGMLVAPVRVVAAPKSVMSISVLGRV